MSKTEVEPYYQRQAKEFVDLMFDKGLMNPELSRNSLQAIEDYIAFTFQSQAYSASRMAEITARRKYESD